MTTSAPLRLEADEESVVDLKNGRTIRPVEPAGAMGALPPACAQLCELLGTAGPVIAQCFQHMALAEDVIGRVSAVHPERAEVLSRAFAMCRWRLPTQPTDEVYRAHVEELLARTLSGESTCKATGAEVLIFLCDASLRAPLASSAAVLFEQLWNQTIGKLAEGEPLFEGNRRPQEMTPGAAAELLGDLSEKLSASDRVLRSTGGSHD